MKRQLLIVLVLMLTASASIAENRENELTGIYHKAHGKQDAMLEIDGHGQVPQIEVQGACLKDIPDGARIWVKGRIKSCIYGDTKTESEQQRPTQWVIYMEVERCRQIDSPFAQGTASEFKR